MLKTFSKPELREFGRFVRSPFHNNRNEVVKFFNELIKFYPFNDNSGISKEVLYSRLYPGKKFNDATLRISSSYLKKLIEEFLSYRKFSQNRIEKKLTLISSLRERKLDKNTEKEIAAAKSLLENEEKIDANYFLVKSRLSMIIDEFSLLKGNKKMMIQNSKDFTDSLICYFMANLFSEISARKVNEEDYNAVFEPDLLSPFINSFDTERFFREIVNYPGYSGIFLFIYYYSFLAEQNFEDDKIQNKLKKILFEHSHKFNMVMAYNIYVMLMNINIYGANERKGDIRYYTRAFELFKDMEAKNLLSGTEYMQEEIFLNILLTTNAIKEFDWADAFVDKNINLLHPGIRNNWFNYSKAFICFNKKQFNRALEFLVTVNFDKATPNVIAKRLLAMIYYELNYNEQLLSLIDTASHYLKNNKKIPKNVKLHNQYFFKALKTLVEVRFSHNNFRLLKLKKKINQNSGVVSWLIKKIDELEKIV